ncbi:uncharacterized protein DNG_00451 [Cephalotrichum gorgonifer]|uniref:Ubiquitin-like domain-containing protein n=1 Tax=Cephalotrichum gorgonifer TaxID=2041049 RepID=A0AAE8SQW8_9PEZI|nr:uncharacterized protein DNG_00451 [Cephalotrichum gorgonifer]
MDFSAPPKKRLPFKRTALRKSNSDPQRASGPLDDGADDGDDGLALFNRSKEMVSMMAAEAERRVTKQKEKEEARRRRSETVETAGGSEESGSAQKRRVSECFGDEDEAGDGYSTPSRQFGSPTTPSKKRYGNSTSPKKFNTPTRVKISSTSMPPPPPSQDDTITILDDADDDDFTQATALPDASSKDGLPSWVTTSLSSTTNRSTPAADSNAPVEVIQDDDVEEVLAPSEEETDPDLQVFINAARERERERQRLAESQESEPKAAEDLKVQVESLIPRALDDGKPVVFKLSSGDPLKTLKTTWCDIMRINNVDLDPADVFFTWRGRRLYNTTTLSGLGISNMGNDLLYAGDMGDRGGLSADRKRVVLQAWTEVLYQKHLEEEERERLRRLGGLDEEEVAGAAGAAPPEEKKIKVTMRPRQGEPVKVALVASSTVGDLVERFRAKRQIPPDVQVAIHFDGERLEEQMALEEADIGDEDQVEVHLN